MEFISNIDLKEFQEFVDNHPNGHFLQSIYWGDVNIARGYKIHHVGLKRDGKLVATALLSEKKLINKFCFFYAPRGFVCDYTDCEIVRTFTVCLENYCKKNNGVFYRIDPAIKLQNLNKRGEVIDDGIDNHPLVEYLVKLGYTHKGFNKFFENSEPRFTSRLDTHLDLEEVKKNFHSTTRQIINRGNLYNLKIYKGNEDNVKDFY